ncbi:uncharacterized protein BDR25DRAFT_339082 [Lindgomyces ingoldianus]|uniref:Uncharacterized protein n=1 Tax=Lindgomyces ingoldianus TaxID=673940 RepID=A0ACB6REU1_9PLEO|nr:uncharacterized protein BDR25DRAFT_339082 [Lindgomyces ingoldianus]KAF2477012.1 hypothetical protein BDR25DRAFT_339082 [Lindgomyces ingoldianus]
MSQKRKHTEFQGGDHPHSASKRSRSNHKVGGPHFKPRWRNQSHSEPKPTSTNTLRSRIRDLKRLLEHVDNEPKYKMPANVRMERERELEASEHELAAKTAVAREADHRKKMIGKYHRVRFFDRQKATRILKRLQRELSSLQDRSKKTDLLRKIHNTEVDINYAQYYPLMKPYSSLYPKSKRENSKSEELAGEEEAGVHRSEDVEQGPKGDVQMWKAIERAMEEGTLDVLRNSKAGLPVIEPKEDNRSKQKEARKYKKKNTQAGIMQRMLEDTNVEVVDEKDDESDGGFFE